MWIIDKRNRVTMMLSLYGTYATWAEAVTVWTVLGGANGDSEFTYHLFENR